jgi:hypothetical protein
MESSEEWGVKLRPGFGGEMATDGHRWNDISTQKKLGIGFGEVVPL